MNTPPYGLSQERYAEMDAELEKMWERLIEMTVEIDKAIGLRNGQSYLVGCRAADGVAMFRHQLQGTAGHMRKGEEIQRRMGRVE